MTESRVAEIMALADALAKAAYGAGRFPCATNDAVVEHHRARLESALREPVEMSDEQIIAIKRATKCPDPTKQWGDSIAFARAIIAAAGGRK